MSFSLLPQPYPNDLRHDAAQQLVSQRAAERFAVLQALGEARAERRSAAARRPERRRAPVDVPLTLR